MRRAFPIVILVALSGCAPALVPWTGPRAHRSSLDEATTKTASARYCACPPKNAFDWRAELPDGMFGQFEHPFVKLPKVQDPLPPPIRYVFGEKFHGETIGLLEARFHAPLEETLDPWLGDFEPTKGDLAELRATLTSLRAKAIAHAESAVVDPSAELMRDLRIAREAYDEAKRSGDEMAKRDARAMISRTYSLGMKKLREVAFGAMTSVVATSYKPDVGYGAVEKVAKQLATEAAMPPEGVGDVVRAAAKRHMLRRGVLAVAGEEVDEIVLRQRPSCAAYLAFD